MHSRGTRSSHVSLTARWLTTLVAVTALVFGTAAPALANSAPIVPAASGTVQTLAGGPVKTSLTGFNAGNIISDAVFTNELTMTEAQIQAFFNSKVKTCQSGYTCLKDYRTDSVNRPADTYCKGYTGAKGESAARIIYRVAQSCNINPQVLIVMLQKEQSLVTHTWPSTWRYDKALGQGCPDDAPCNPDFVGFFYQIYGAARYMQMYMEGRWFTWYPPGKTLSIQWHPNKACGTAPVAIANKATSALYYYTPYQPNAAAMRAGYGTGDSCSSYGNRNFYNYFTDWFGSTQQPASAGPVVSGAIATEWQRLGGAAGQLGKPLAAAKAVKTNGGGYVQAFEKGKIWHRNGAATAFGMGGGAFLTNYEKAGAQDGGWGWPMSSAVCGLVDGGCRMNFQFGTTYYSPGTQSVLVPTITAAAYAKQGGEASPLGYPRGTASTASGVTQQSFVKGLGIYTTSTGLVRLSAGIANTWGGVGSIIGMPLRNATAVAGNGGGVVQEFTKGTIWESPSGAFAMGFGPLRDSYVRSGGPAGSWGWPSSAARCGLTGGGCWMVFTKGTIGYSPATGSVLMSGATATEWLRLGPAPIGYPKAVAKAVAQNGGGTEQAFTKGTFWASPSGAFAMGFGPLRDSYVRSGGPAGSWGWPSSAARCGLTGGGCWMVFTKGTIGYSPATGSVLMSGATATEWLRLGPAPIGYPKAVAKAVAQNGGGTEQAFTKGTFWASPSGAFAMGFGPLRDSYVRSGGPAGSWGWPSSAARCGLTGGGCWMVFTKGTIGYSPATGSVLMSGATATEWLRLGPAPIGYPKAVAKAVAQNGGGTEQAFTKGTFWASPSGAFAMGFGPLRDAYVKANAAAGSWGWPAGAAKCGLAGGDCTMAFTNGTAYYDGATRGVTFK